MDRGARLLYTRCMLRLLSIAVLYSLLPSSVFAQWQMEESNTLADLRGIVSVGGSIAWASGSGGTVVRTENGGSSWKICAQPAGAGKLDFRAIQAFDESTALVMSSGTGDLSRLYRTTDGCRTWTLLQTNTDKTGFWDALQFTDRQHGTLLGDPVSGHFVMLTTADGGTTWIPIQVGPADSVHDQGIFAASNSSLLMSSSSSRTFCTGGQSGATVFRHDGGPQPGPVKLGRINFGTTTSAEELVSFNKSASSGCFSLAGRHDDRGTVVAVGGDYAHPEQTDDTAWTTAMTDDIANKEHPLFRFAPAKTKPGGYRSAVAFNPGSNSWITVGPGGTDISTDDGRTWRPLKPSPQDAPDAGKQWNALSLPFVVGPHGRIGKLHANLLTSP